MKRNAPPNLRPAPASLTPAVADRLVALAGILCAGTKFPPDASIATSGRTNGDVQPKLVAAVEAGRDLEGTTG